VSGTVRTAFDRARAEQRAALVGYLPAGFPDAAGAVEAMKVMVGAGCDLIEVGLPYSDPVMDGPTIQAAAQRALEHGTRTADVLRTVEAVAGTGAKVVVMTYWNPIQRYGVERFAADLAAAGGSGLITPDLVPDEADEWVAAADAHDLDKVFLVVPRLRLRHRGHGCDRGPHVHQRPRRPARRAHPPVHRPAGRRGPRGLQRVPGGRGRPLRRRGDRRVRVRPAAARRRGRPAGRARLSRGADP
jgi:hypothetical protein